MLVLVMEATQCLWRRGCRRAIRRRLLGIITLLVLASGAGAPIFASSRALTRYPTLHGDTIAFEAAGNLWSVARQGGTARRLTTDRGTDLMPRFSPDGALIAFTGQYDGNTDVYVIPAEGGSAKRLTFHSDAVPDPQLRWGPDNMVVSWTADGQNIVFLSRRDTFNSWFGRLFEVSKDGGLPEALPLPTGGMTSFNAEGTKIAYNRIFRNFRTWKDYYGGLAQDVWIYDLQTKRIDRVTDWKGTDSDPMWYGNVIYFASDRGPDKRLNLWAYDLTTKAFHQVTHFEDFDIDWPSLGDTGIVFQCGGGLYVVDLPDETLHEVKVELASDLPSTRAGFVNARETIQDFDIAPNGKRVLFGARGEIFTVPEKDGNTRDVTQASAAREQYPAWSPDGKNVAYVTDRTGEAEIAIRPADGTGEEKILTARNKGYLYGPVWSPDSKKLAYSDSDHVLWILNVDDRKATRVDEDPREEIHDYAWSPDASWVVYDKLGSNYLREVYLYSLASNVATRVSTGEVDDHDAVFDPEGKYLFFASGRHENPVFSESELNVATVATDGIYVATLQEDEASPFAPKTDEGVPETKSEQKESEWAPGAIPSIRIDLDGLFARAVPVPIASGSYGGLTAGRTGLYYMKDAIRAFEKPISGEPELRYFDMTERKDHELVSPLDGYALSANGAEIVYQEKKNFFLRKSAPGDDEAEPSQVDLEHLKSRIDPVEEWREMFGQAWRLERDLFFNPHMNGVDWVAIRDRYQKLLPELTCRQDLNYVIGEMLGELHNSHTYVGGGDEPHTEAVPTGLLGVDFGLDPDSGRYYFEKILRGDNSRPDYRSPLTEPGVQAAEGDYLLAVDGNELRAPTNPYSLFVNKLGGTVTLTLADSAQGANRHDVTVEPVASELAIRRQQWIDTNRRKVDEASGGKIGYLYLSDMDELGMDQFIRQFYSQIDKQGLIVDVRYNGGGFIDQILLERLRRVLAGMTTNREGVPFPIPGEMVNGAMACLINHYSASDGDIFPYFFRKYGLGPLIGTRTWGGVRGIRGYWPLADGGYITIPEESLYGLDSQWILENHGVEPDIEVDNLPGDEASGKDAQLDKAIETVMKEISAHPKTLPKHPPWPGDER
jgi:tricorn protease